MSSRWLEAKIAFRSFKSLKESSFISFTAWVTLLGISVGVMAVIVVMSVMNGFEKELQKNIIGAESHIVLYRKDKGIPKWKKLKSEIKSADDTIQSVLPITFHEVLFVYKGKVHGGILEGVEPESMSVVQSLAGKKIGEEECFIGEELSKKLNVQSGDVVKVLLPDPTLKGSSKVIELKVAGLFQSGLYEYSSRYVYANLYTIQKKIGWLDRVSAFKISIKDPHQAFDISRKIRTKVAFPFFVKTWMHMNQNIFLAIKIEKIVMLIILAAIIGVAIFNVMSSLIMIVVEKAKEISILKAIGMQKAKIQNIFLWYGFFIGVAGTGMGLGLALGMCEILSHFRLIPLSPDIYYLSFLPVEIRGIEVGIVSVAVIAISFLAALFPAHRAASMLPMEGIRYE